MKNHYGKFFVMLVLSFIIMYSVMFLNVDNISHVHFSLTRMYMSLLMVCPMAILMLLLMSSMFGNRKMNRVILISSAVIFIIALVSLRQQVFINDVQYMKAMIPHHSSAILTSKKANITDSQVNELSREIIDSQEREISEMETALERLE